ncbi:hypothetical protein D3C87_1387520 [compost metagenome]
MFTSIAIRVSAAIVAVGQNCVSAPTAKQATMPKDAASSIIIRCCKDALGRLRNTRPPRLDIRP